MKERKPREESLEHVLRKTLGRSMRASRGAECVDAETLAAWSERGLRSQEAARVERHISNCERCQRVLATLAVAAPAPAVAPSWSRRWHLRWVVPLATAATVAAVWVAMPSKQPSTEVERERRTEGAPAVSAEKDTSAVVSPAPVPAPAAPPVASSLPPSSANREEQKAKRERAVERGAVSGSAGAQEREQAAQRGQAEGRMVTEDQLAKRQRGAADAAAPMAAPAAPVAPESGRAAAFRTVSPEIVAPDGTRRWRIVDGGRRVERSSTAGQWEPLDFQPAAPVIAGAAPSPTVVWLVGRAGGVYLSIDGSSFTRLPFGEAVDLVSVTAVDDRQATVTTVDGRPFHTPDRGAHWTR